MIGVDPRANPIPFHGNDSQVIQGPRPGNVLVASVADSGWTFFDLSKWAKAGGARGTVFALGDAWWALVYRDTADDLDETATGADSASPPAEAVATLVEKQAGFWSVPVPQGGSGPFLAVKSKSGSVRVEVVRQ